MALNFSTLLAYIMLGSYAAAFIVSMISLPRYHDSSLRFLPFILLYTFLNETLGYLIYSYPEFKLIDKEGFEHYNIIIYNIYDIIFFPYFYYVFWSYIIYEKYKKIVFLGGALFFLISFFNLYFQNPMLTSQIITYVYGGLFLIYCILLYFSKLRYAPKKSVKQDLLFWVSCGLLVFFVGYLPIEIYRYYNSIYQLSEPFYVRHIQRILIIAMYLLIIIGFIKMNGRKASVKSL